MPKTPFDSFKGFITAQPEGLVRLEKLLGEKFSDHHCGTMITMHELYKSFDQSFPNTLMTEVYGKECKVEETCFGYDTALSDSEMPTQTWVW